MRTVRTWRMLARIRRALKNVIALAAGIVSAVAAIIAFISAQIKK